MQLIDREELYNTLAGELLWLMDYGLDVYGLVGECLNTAINSQPAYDVDKVVEQLENHAEACRENARKFEAAGMEHASRKMYAKAYSYEDAVKIVEGGGRDERK